MLVTLDKNKLLVTGVGLIPSQTLECGQTFRYRKNGCEDYDVFAGENHCRVIAENGGITVLTDNPAYFIRYFDFKTDYTAIRKRLNAFPELRTAVACGEGIRILRQEPYETVVSFILSANNNIPRIQGILERLCQNCGENKGGYHAFPSPERLARVTEQEFRALGCGFRAPYLVETAARLRDGTLLHTLMSADTSEAARLLCGLKGVGVKVANCILLFGLGRTECFPVDTWIFKGCRTAQLDTPQKVQAYYTRRYGDLAGYAQQYLFYAGRTNRFKQGEQ